MASPATMEGGGGVRLLPPWESVRAKTPPPRNPVLIDGLLRRGHVMMLAGKGKTGKSWAAIQLAVAVATGSEWLGRRCEQGGVLFIDPEIDHASLDNRFAAVCRETGADAREVGFHVAKWPLRGVEGANMGAIVSDLEQFATRGQFALIIIDSASVFVEGDENSAVDVRGFFAKVLRVSEITGAAVVIVHHYGKGAAGDRSAADRARGSSVWLDAPDAALFLTEVFPPSGELPDYLEDGERALVLEMGGQREFPTAEPVRLVYRYPVHRLDTESITDGWKPSSSQREGVRKTNEIKKATRETNVSKSEAELLAYFYAENIGTEGVTLKDAAEAVGVDPRTLEAYLQDSRYFEIVAKSQRKRFVRAIRPPEPHQGTIKLED